jgi:hypothetical protein
MSSNVPDPGRTERPNSDVPTIADICQIVDQPADLARQTRWELAATRAELDGRRHLRVVPDVDDLATAQSRRLWLQLAENRRALESMRRHPSSWPRPTLRLVEGGAG